MTEFTSSNDGDRQPEPQDFHSAVFEFEEKLLRQALVKANNKPTTAARLLGLNTHQTLLAMLDNRHKKLRDELGITKRVRRKAIIKR
jgi:hypothetical protein